MFIVDQIRGTAASANVSTVINPRLNDVTKKPLNRPEQLAEKITFNPDSRAAMLLITSALPVDPTA